MKIFFVRLTSIVLLYASAFGAEQDKSSSDLSLVSNDLDGNLRGTADFSKTLNIIATIDEDEEDNKFSTNDLLVFASDCYSYPTASEKRACQRSMRNFERCVERSTYRQCCRDADSYQRRLRCGSPTPPSPTPPSPSPPGTCGASCSKTSDCFHGGFVQCGTCYGGTCVEDTCSRYCPNGKNSECKSSSGYQNCGKCDTRYYGTRYQCYDPSQEEMESDLESFEEREGEFLSNSSAEDGDEYVESFEDAEE